MRISDWSSDVCSSDLDRRNRRDGGDLRVGRAADAIGAGGGHRARLYFGLNRQFHPPFAPELVEGLSFTSAAKGRTVLRQAKQDRKSVVQGKSGSVRVDLGGRRNIKKKKK